MKCMAERKIKTNPDARKERMAVMKKNRREIRNYEYMEYGVYGPADECDKDEKRVCCKTERIPSLEKLMLVLGGILVLGFAFLLFGDYIKELPESVSVIGWTVVSFVVAGLASVGL